MCPDLSWFQGGPIKNIGFYSFHILESFGKSFPSNDIFLVYTLFLKSIVWHFISNNRLQPKVTLISCQELVKTVSTDQIISVSTVGT